MLRLFLAFLVLFVPSLATAGDRFPVALQHVYGSTTISAPPQRIVTWGWGNDDAAIALGVVPVGVPFQTYGGGEDGLQRWTEEALTKLGAAKPTTLGPASSPPFEQIAALKPDLILAVFSGITEDEYTLLSAIAPTVAYSGEPYSTPWQDVTRTVGKALGKSEEAEKLVSDTTAWLAEEFASRPSLAKVTFASANDFDGSMAVYAPLDARMKFLTDLGLKLNSSVAALAPAGSHYYYPLSYELFDELKGDIFVTYYETQDALDAFLAKPYARNYPPIAEGGLAALVGTENVAAVSPPTALSLRWGLPHYLDVLEAAASKALAK